MADSIKLHPEERFLAEEGTHFHPSTFQPLLENYVKLAEECSKFETDAGKARSKVKSLYKEHNIESCNHYQRKMRNESIRDQIRPKEQEIEALFKRTLPAVERLVAARFHLLGPQERLKEQKRLERLSPGERDQEKLRLTDTPDGDDIYQEGIAFKDYGWPQLQPKMLKDTAFSIQFARENEAVLRDKYGPNYNIPTGGYNNANSSFANSAYNAAQFRAQQTYNQQQANQNWLNGAQTSINNMSLNR
jgi:hypothetical protein